MTRRRALRAGLAAASAAGLLAFGGIVVTRRVARAREILRGGTSFGSSYVPPLFDEIVHSRLRYSGGTYEVVVRPRTGGEPAVLSGSSKTAVRGLANHNAFVVSSVDGNRTMLRAGRRGTEPPAVERMATWLLPGLGADGRHAILRSRGGLETLDLSTGRIEPMPANPRVLDSLRSPQLRFVQAALGAEGGQAVVITRVGERLEMRLVSLPDGRAVTLRESTDILMRPRFAQDGASFTFVERTSSGWHVRRWRVDDGSETTLFRSHRFIESAEAHPDGRHLLLTLGDDAEFRGYMFGLHVYELDVPSGRLERIGE